MANRQSNQLTTISRINLTREVKMQLAEAIRRGDFAPGQQLPSERELTQMFGVSRVAVREALRALEALGRVRVEHGRGAFVTDRRSAFGESMSEWLEQHSDELVELHMVRGALDVVAAQQAVAHFDPVRIEAVVAAQAQFGQAVDTRADAQLLVELDIDFHLAIADASKNRLLYDLLTDLHAYLAEARIPSFAKPGRAARSRAEHDAIVKALVAADLEGANEAMRVHLISSTGYFASTR